MDFQESLLRIERKDSFTLSRWGDGEFHCLMGHRGENCDGVVYSDRLRNDLLSVLRDPENPRKRNYYFGLLKVAPQEIGEYFKTFLRNSKLTVKWSDGDIFMAESKQGRLLPLIQLLRRSRILYVGPDYLESLKADTFHIKEFVTCPRPDAYEYWEEIRDEVLQKAKRIDLIGVSMGLAAKVLIHSLYDFLGDRCCIIDFGAMWDGYVGVKSRKYFKTDDWNAILKRNLGEVGNGNSSSNL